MNVVNRTGGNGVVGHSAIAAVPAPDGYTLGLITVEIAMMHWQGSRLNSDPASYTPLALVNADPAGFQVAAGLEVQDRSGRARRDQGQPRQAEGLRRRRRAASGSSRSPAC